MAMWYKYQKEEDMTYFKKIKKTTIDEVNEDEVVYLKVRNPRKYGPRELEYYGKIIRKTNDYFNILEYTYRSDNWHTEDIERWERNPKQYTKKRAKKSIIEIYKVKCQQKKELHVLRDMVKSINVKIIKDI